MSDNLNSDIHPLSKLTRQLRDANVDEGLIHGIISSVLWAKASVDDEKLKRDFKDMYGNLAVESVKVLVP